MELATAIHGGKTKAAFLRGMPALADAQERITDEASKGYIRNIDGSRIPVDYDHTAFNYKIQGGGAKVSKRWLWYIYRDLLDAGYIYERDFELHAFIHDGVVASARPEIAEDVARIMTEAALRAGRYFKMRVPIEAKASIGDNWKQVH